MYLSISNYYKQSWDSVRVCPCVCALSPATKCRYPSATTWCDPSAQNTRKTRLFSLTTTLAAFTSSKTKLTSCSSVSRSLIQIMIDSRNSELVARQPAESAGRLVRLACWLLQLVDAEKHQVPSKKGANLSSSSSSSCCYSSSSSSSSYFFCAAFGCRSLGRSRSSTSTSKSFSKISLALASELAQIRTLLFQFIAKL